MFVSCEKFCSKHLNLLNLLIWDIAYSEKEMKYLQKEDIYGGLSLEKHETLVCGQDLVKLVKHWTPPPSPPPKKKYKHQGNS